MLNDCRTAGTRSCFSGGASAALASSAVLLERCWAQDLTLELTRWHSEFRFKIPSPTRRLPAYNARWPFFFTKTTQTIGLKLALVANCCSALEEQLLAQVAQPLSPSTAICDVHEEQCPPHEPQEEEVHSCLLCHWRSGSCLLPSTTIIVTLALSNNVSICLSSCSMPVVSNLARTTRRPFSKERSSERVPSRFASSASFLLASCKPILGGEAQLRS